MTTISETCRAPAKFSARPTLGSGAARTVLRASAEHSGPAVIVSAAGAVDASNEGAWELLLGKTAAAAIAPGPFVVNVQDLDFMGCCAFAALARQAERCRRRNISVCLVSDRRVVARTVAACGLRLVLPIYRSIEVALARSHRRFC
jgi:anti-anti-sigma factor